MLTHGELLQARRSPPGWISPGMGVDVVESARFPPFCAHYIKCTSCEGLSRHVLSVTVRIRLVANSQGDDCSHEKHAYHSKACHPRLRGLRAAGGHWRGRPARGGTCWCGR